MEKVIKDVIYQLNEIDFILKTNDLENELAIRERPNGFLKIYYKKAIDNLKETKEIFFKIRKELEK